MMSHVTELYQNSDFKPYIRSFSMYACFVAAIYCIRFYSCEVCTVGCYYVKVHKSGN